MADPNDIFDDFDSWDDSIDSPRSSGRPATRRYSDKGPNGRPRVRPLEDKYSRRRGRPAITTSSVGDRIQKEALIDGGYAAKSLLSSAKGIEQASATFLTKVITPLEKSVSAFSQAVNQFNSYHQQYLKDQMAMSKELHETFKLFRKASIDPLLRTLARTQKGTKAVSDTFKVVYESGFQGKEFRDLSSKMEKTNKVLYETLRTGVVATEATDTFLKEYYKTTKGTSKFMNSVAYAVEDVSEDIAALKDNMAKYFKGKTNKSILQDQTETLLRIEKNTAAPSIGKRMLYGAAGALTAGVKTAFKYNRYGVTQLLASMTGARIPGVEKMDDLSGKKGFFAKITKTITDAYDIAIRQKVRDRYGKLQYTWEATQAGAYGEGAQAVAEGLHKASSRVKDIVQGIRSAWNKSKTKKWASWFWEVGKVFLYNAYDRAGAQGERNVAAVMTNYASKKGNPHPGDKKYAEDIIRDVAQGKYKWKDEGGNFMVDIFSRQKRYSGGESPYYDMFGGNALAKTVPISNATGRFTFKQGGRRSLISAEEKAERSWGKGNDSVVFESKSESDINSADVSSPKAAFASLAKLMGRGVGYLKKIWKNDKEASKPDSGNKEGGGWLANLLGWLGVGTLAMKNRKFLRGANGKGLSKLGKTLFTSHAFLKGYAGKNVGAAAYAGTHHRALRLGGTLRTLWGTFGWGNLRGKGAMAALGTFKNTRLGKSAFGDLVRRIRISQLMGRDLGSRLLGGITTANKWGGVKDLWGAGSGIFNALGIKNTGKWYAPKIVWDGRRAISRVGGEAAKGGSRVRNILKAEEAAKFAAKYPEIAQHLGTGFFARRAASISNVVGGIAGTGLNIVKGTGKVAGKAAMGIGKSALNTAKAVPGAVMGFGKTLAKIPSKDKLLGGILAGAGAKALGKAGGKGIAKALAKQIPILGAIIGLGFGIKRFTEGDVLGGILEITSGLLTLVPSGATNAAALGIDAFLVGRDFKNRNKKKEAEEKTKEKVNKNKILDIFHFGGKKKNAKSQDVQKAADDAAEKAKQVIQNAGAADKSVAAQDAKASETNALPISQQSPLDGNSYAIPAQIPQQQKPKIGFWQSVGNAFTKAGISAKDTLNAFLATHQSVPAGDKHYTDEDTGAIVWNGHRHDKLMPEFKRALFSAANEFHQVTGKKVGISDAIRTDEEQATLWYRANVLKDPHVYMPARPVNDYKELGIIGTHKNNRTGHLAGGAVDVKNWKEFVPYAQKYGLHWFGSKDPVHFQIDKSGPVVTSAAAKPAAKKPVPTPTSNKTGVGDGDPFMGKTQPYTSTSSGRTSVQGSAGAGVTEISPMIQDYGLAIINNLLFA